MGRNNLKNIKLHNDKLHQAQAKQKAAATLRKQKLKTIIRQANAKDSTQQ